MEIVQSLFDLPTISPSERKESRVAESKRKAALAYQKTSAAWQRATHQAAIEEFLPNHSTFIFEDFTLFYNSVATRQKWPATVEPRAFAGVRKRLIDEGFIEVVPNEFRNRTQGSPSAVYRSLVK